MFRRILSAWSLRRNLKSIFVRPHATYQSLDGIRAISMFWVVFAHVLMGVDILCKNGFCQASDAMSWIDNMPVSLWFVWHGFKVLDTFFVLSGFLIGSLLFFEEKKKGSINLKRFYWRRYLRLMPVYGFVILLFVWLGIEEPTQPYIWANIFYVNNFLEYKQMFMNWTWSLAVEEQFYLLLPLLLIGFFFKSKHKISLIVGMFVLSFIIRLGILLANPDVASISFTNQLFHGQPGYSPRYFEVIYDNIYSRYGPFCVGVLAAWLYIQKPQQLEHFFKQRWVLSSSLFLLSTAFLVAICWFPLFKSDFELTGWLKIAYETSHHNLWAMAIGYSMLAFMFPVGLARIFNWVLSWKIWYPVAQLSYSTYLLHVPIIIGAYQLVAINRHPELLAIFKESGMPGIMSAGILNRLTMADIGWVFAVTVLVSFALGMVCYLLIEKPLMNLRPQEKKKPQHTLEVGAEKEWKETHKPAA